MRSKRPACAGSLPLTFGSFRAFNKAFDVLEYRCPPISRLSDNDRSQLVGTLFIKDPAARKNWSDHINQPEIFNGNGVRVSGPPRTYVEAKLLAEKVLRSAQVLTGIDELSSPSISLAAGSMAALMSNSSSSASGSSGVSAQQIFEALVTDPRKSFAGGASSAHSTVTPFVPIDVPRGEDGKFLYWAPPMKQCDCGTPDEGRHIRDKWPCANYRNPDKHLSESTGSKGSKGNTPKVLLKSVEPDITGFDFLVPDLPRFLPYRAIGLKPERSKAAYFKEAAESMLLNNGSDRFGLLRSISGRTHPFPSDACAGHGQRTVQTIVSVVRCRGAKS